jgi:hypothetical protein
MISFWPVEEEHWGNAMLCSIGYSSGRGCAINKCDPGPKIYEEANRAHLQHPRHFPRLLLNDKVRSRAPGRLVKLSYTCLGSKYECISAPNPHSNLA